MGSPRKLDPEKHSKRTLIENYVRYSPEASCREVNEFYGLDPDSPEGVSSSYVSTIKTALQEARQLELSLTDEVAPRSRTPQKRKKKTARNDTVDVVPAPPRRGESTGNSAYLVAENKYLRWALDGERFGHFDRWVAEMEKSPHD